MRTSQYLLATLKETPSDAEIVSHQLMLRAGLVRQLASGLYHWLPTGLRILQKITTIVREEMDRAGALEVLLPMVQPSSLWEQSGRLELYGPELSRFNDRHDKLFCLGPTHEEVITDLVKNNIQSYKQLPLNLYQINTKFRDEIRPRFGIMRAREFIMKDAYSFHLDQASLEDTYQLMYETYCRIFERIGLNFCAVWADAGSIGGNRSQEFHVLAETGEDEIASNSNGYTANVELVPLQPASTLAPEPQQDFATVATPNQKTIAEVAEFLQLPTQRIVKTLVVHGIAESDPNESESDNKVQPLIALILRGDHELNAVKAEQLSQVKTPLTFASATEIQTQLQCGIGSLGPVDCPIPIIVDYAASITTDFACGANQENKHHIGVNWERDCPLPTCADLRNVVAGDPAPDGSGPLTIQRGIEVGHIFQLGDKYSQALNAAVLNEQGKSQILTMGCYGIGVSRLVAATIEQNHDTKGICWPTAIAPFDIALVTLNFHKSKAVKDCAENLYKELQAQTYQVLLDDRKERLGVQLKDMDLLGIPYCIIIGQNEVLEGNVLVKARSETEKQSIALSELKQFLTQNVRKSVSIKA